LPLKSGGAVDSEFMRGRTVQGLVSIGKAVVCPSGEQITNGGFETGDFTGWETSGYPAVTTVNPRTGNYSCYFAGQGYIQQSFTGVPKICLTPSSVLGYYRSLSRPFYGTRTHGWAVTLIYEDETETVIGYEKTVWGGGGYPSYEFEDLKDYVEPGKVLVGIKISFVSGPGGIYIDDVTCNV
jgi:hypothetical protein